VLVSLLIGMLAGVAIAPFFGPHHFAYTLEVDHEAWRDAIGDGDNASWTFPFELNSEQITSRGTPASLIGGTLIAIPSGFGVVLAVTSGGSNALVGVAIAAALLPPVVNCGLCLALASCWAALSPLMPAEGPRDIHPYSMVAAQGVYSFCLFLLNWLAITIVGALTFRLKGISYESTDAKHFMQGEHGVVREARRALWQQMAGVVTRPHSRAATSRGVPEVADSADPVRSLLLFLRLRKPPLHISANDDGDMDLEGCTETPHHLKSNSSGLMCLSPEMSARQGAHTRNAKPLWPLSWPIGASSRYESVYYEEASVPQTGQCKRGYSASFKLF